MVHRECAIECCRAVGIFYTLEDGKSAKCPNHHESLKEKLNSFQEIDNNGGTVMRLIKEVTVTRGVVRRIVVMKSKKMMSRLKKKEQTLMEMMKNQGKTVELREPIKLYLVAI